ncbi:MAG: SsrA-binding protein SmpB [Solirubrobacteraceae bacterium]
MQKKINIENRKAKFNFEFIEKFDAGIQLLGTEIKSIRMGKVSIAESFCEFKNSELYIVNMHIEEYSYGGKYYNHVAKRERKLLLKAKEIKKLLKEVKNVGLTIIPTRLYVNDRGLAKLIIALSKGKKLYDKRESIKEREVKRDLDRKIKS